MGPRFVICRRDRQPQCRSNHRGERGVTVLALALGIAALFLAAGIAVIELAHRYPGEGGVYLWAKRVFGDFHGFLSGWCYWTNNIFLRADGSSLFRWHSVYVAGRAPARLPTILGSRSAHRWSFLSFLLS